MKCQKVPLPQGSALSERLAQCDYVDSYQLELGRELPLDVTVHVFCSPMPWLVAALMKARDFVARRFHLKTATRYVAGTPDTPTPFKPGDTMGFFRVYERTEREAILGEDDTHLNFRVSLLTEGTRLTVSTMVFYNNRIGRAYFAVVKHFHRLIVPLSLAKDFREYLAQHGAG